MFLFLSIMAVFRGVQAVLLHKVIAWRWPKKFVHFYYIYKHNMRFEFNCLCTTTTCELRVCLKAYLWWWHGAYYYYCILIKIIRIQWYTHCRYILAFAFLYITFPIHPKIGYASSNIQSDSYWFLRNVKNKLVYELKETRFVMNLLLLFEMTKHVLIHIKYLILQ